MVLHNCGNTTRGNYTTPTIYQKKEGEKNSTPTKKYNTKIRNEIEIKLQLEQMKDKTTELHKELKMRAEQSRALTTQVYCSVLSLSLSLPLRAFYRFD